MHGLQMTCMIRSPGRTYAIRSRSRGRKTACLAGGCTKRLSFAGPCSTKITLRKPQEERMNMLGPYPAGQSTLLVNTFCVVRSLALLCQGRTDEQRMDGGWWLVERAMVRAVVRLFVSFAGRPQTLRTTLAHDDDRQYCSLFCVSASTVLSSSFYSPKLSPTMHVRRPAISLRVLPLTP